MRNIFRNTLSAIGIAAVASLALSGCDKGGKNLDEHDYLAVRFGDKDGWSIIDSKGKVVVNEEYGSDDEVSDIYGEVYWVKSGSTIQLYSLKSPKKPLSDTEYEAVTNFCNGRALAVRKGSPIELVDNKGKVVTKLPTSISSIGRFNEFGYAVFEKKEKGSYGILDTDGKIVFEEVCAGVTNVSEKGYFLFVKNEDDKKVQLYKLPNQKVGDLRSEKFQPIMYSDVSAYGFYEGLMAVVENPYTNEDKSVTYINDKLEKEFTIKKSSATSTNPGGFRGGVATFQTKEGLFGLVDKSGEELIRPKYQRLYNLGNNRIVAMRDDKCGIINSSDEVIVPLEYDGSAKFLMGDNYVMRQGKYYYIIDEKGKEVAKDGFKYLAFFDVVSEWLHYEPEVKADATMAQETSGEDDSQYDEFQSDEDEFQPDGYDFACEREVTAADLAGMSKDELRIMRNWIFARHGYKFKSRDLQEYFGQFGWYEPRYTDITSQLSSIEKRNIEFIKRHE